MLSYFLKFRFLMDVSRHSTPFFLIDIPFKLFRLHFSSIVFIEEALFLLITLFLFTLKGKYLLILLVTRY